MKRKIKKSRADNVFDIINIILMFIVLIVTLYPFYSQIIISIASPQYVYHTKVILFPDKLDIKGWAVMMNYDSLWRGYFNTIVRTLLGVVLSTLTTALMAYPLSKNRMPFNKFITTMILITMFFSGGLIPSYILIRSLHMFNTIWVMVIPGLLSGFNIFIMRNFFKDLPQALEESARIDGASYLRIFFSIVLPLSTPVLATIALWIGVGHWQEWFSNMLYVQDSKKQVMMMVARKILVENNLSSLEEAQAKMGNFKSMKGAPNEQQLKSCVIVASILPMLFVYPFVQKYFVKGITLGAVKG